MLLATLAPSALAQNAYVTNFSSNTVSVINTETNQAVGAIPVGEGPDGIAITPDGSTAYVANYGSNTVSVINTQTNQAVGAIPVGNPHPTMLPLALGIDYPHPVGIAITPDGRFAYVSNSYSSESVTYAPGIDDTNDISVIDTKTNQVVASISDGIRSGVIAITPDGSTAYVAAGAGLSAIDTQTHQVQAVNSATIGTSSGIAITPDGETAYVARPWTKEL